MEYEFDKEFKFSLNGENRPEGIETIDSVQDRKKLILISVANPPKFPKKDANVFRARLDLCFNSYKNIQYRYDLFDYHSFVSRERAYFTKYIGNDIKKKIYSSDIKKAFKLDMKTGVDVFTKAFHKGYGVKGSDEYKKKKSELSSREFVAGASYLLKKMKIKHSIYSVGNRCLNNYDSDADYLSYFDVDAYLIYFPSIDLLWDPSCKYCESYYIPYRFLGQELVFLGEYQRMFQVETYPQDKIDRVPVPPCDFSKRITKINLSFDDEPTANYSFSQNIQGYYSANLKSWYRHHNASGERFEKNMKEILEDFGEAPEVVDYTITGNEKKEIVLEANMKDESMAKELGDKVMFSIGSIIGNQYEMYDSIQRVNPILYRYPKKYQYEIRIKIPDGYEFLSSENVKLNDQVTKDGKPVYGWKSDFVIEGDEIV